MAEAQEEEKVPELRDQDSERQIAVEHKSGCVQKLPGLSEMSSSSMLDASLHVNGINTVGLDDVTLECIGGLTLEENLSACTSVETVPSGDQAIGTTSAVECRHDFECFENIEGAITSASANVSTGYPDSVIQTIGNLQDSNVSFIMGALSGSDSDVDTTRDVDGVVEDGHLGLSSPGTLPMDDAPSTVVMDDDSLSSLRLDIPFPRHPRYPYGLRIRIDPEDNAREGQQEPVAETLASRLERMHEAGATGTGNHSNMLSLSTRADPMAVLQLQRQFQIDQFNCRLNDNSAHYLCSSATQDIADHDADMNMMVEGLFQESLGRTARYEREHEQFSFDDEEEDTTSGIDRQCLLMLHRSVINNEVTAVEVLVSAGVPASVVLDGYEVEHNGYSAVHIACMKGYHQILETLLTAVVDCDIVATSGETPLHVACKYGNVSCVQVLAQHECDVNFPLGGWRGLAGDSPLLTTVACYRPESPKENDYLEIAKILIDEGCDVNQTDAMGLAPIHLSVTKHNSDMTKLLLAHGANVDVSSNYVMTPLMRAIESGRKDNVHLLIRSGCDVNLCSGSGMIERMAPLHLAVQNTDVEALLHLLCAGADTNAKDQVGCSPMYYCTKPDKVLMLLLLVSHGGYINETNGPDGSPLLLTVTRQESLAGLKLLIIWGANPNRSNRFGTTPIWAAVKLQRVELMKELILANCQLDILSMEYFLLNPLTAFQLAMTMGRFDLAQLLAMAGCLVKRLWFNMWFYVHHTLAENSEMMRWLERWLRNPRGLRFLCRKTIRKSIGLHIDIKLQGIRYPETLKNYIMMKDLFQDT